MSNGVKLAVLLLLAVLCGAGCFVGLALLKNHQLAQETKLRETKLKTAEQNRRAAEAAEKEKALAEKAAKAQEAENLKERQETARQEAEAKAKAAIAAEEETKRLAAEAERQKAEAKQSEAKRKELEAQRALEEVALKRATEDRKKAEAEAARLAAAKATAEAALAKSENDRKTAEANAAAEHDRKLRMYRRAETSRAEMLELQRAERALALEESGASLEDIQAAMNNPLSSETGTEADAPQTNAVVNVTWRKSGGEIMPVTAELSKAETTYVDASRQRIKSHARDYVVLFGKLIDRADRDGHVQDAVRFREMLVTFVPDVAIIFCERIKEARAAGREDDAKKACADLIALMPDWKRVGTMVELLVRDEEYFSKTLAGLVTKDEYVKAFRRLYDKARRSNADRDEREEKMERICKVLATYVPDFESSPEWK